MSLNKIVRSLCYFTDDLNSNWQQRLDDLSEKLQDADFEIQTQRLCLGGYSIAQASEAIQDNSLFVSVGSLTRADSQSQLEDFLAAGNLHFNMNITDGVDSKDVAVLFEIIKRNPSKTFNFTYTVNVPPSSPYYPSAYHDKNGFALGLQSTDLSANCDTVSAWLDNKQEVWRELVELFADNTDFIGIDSSVAPLDGDSSFIAFIERVHKPFSQATTTDIFTQISSFIKTQNPQPTGLCGLMFPCLEDSALARAYEQGEFTIERNIFLSLHSGLGIDTYPIAIDDSPERVLEILQLLRALSIRYNKPLSARFVSDGKSKIGEQSDFQNQYLQDVILRKL